MILDVRAWPSTIRHHVTNRTISQNAGALGWHEILWRSDRAGQGLASGTTHSRDTGMPTGVRSSSARLRVFVSGPAFQVGSARLRARGPLT
jgi:hypothetical protein